MLFQLVGSMPCFVCAKETEECEYCCQPDLASGLANFVCALLWSLQTSFESMYHQWLYGVWGREIDAWVGQWWIQCMGSLEVEINDGDVKGLRVL